MKTTAHTHNPAHPCIACCYYPCAHCRRDIGTHIAHETTGPNGKRGRTMVAADGSSCVTCRGTVCRRCAGGSCER